MRALKFSRFPVILTALFLVCIARTARASEIIPDSCGIIATQAYLKLEDAPFRKLISFTFIETARFPEATGHMVCVWQPFEGSHILVFNSLGTLGTIELDTSSHNVADITKALAAAKKIIIVGAHFVK